MISGKESRDKYVFWRDCRNITIVLKKMREGIVPQSVMTLKF